jgi:hypothetical protein
MPAKIFHLIEVLKHIQNIEKTGILCKTAHGVIAGKEMDNIGHSIVDAFRRVSTFFERVIWVEKC